MSRFLIFGFLLLGLSGCAGFGEDLTEAKSYIMAKNYEQAIAALSNFKGSAAKKLLSDAYVLQAEVLLRDTKTDKPLRYNYAQDTYAKALDANPQNQKARMFYQMMIKIREDEDFNNEPA